MLLAIFNQRGLTPLDASLTGVVVAVAGDLVFGIFETEQFSGCVVAPFRWIIQAFGFTTASASSIKDIVRGLVLRIGGGDLLTGLVVAGLRHTADGVGAVHGTCLPSLRFSVTLAGEGINYLTILRIALQILFDFADDMQETE